MTTLYPQSYPIDQGFPFSCRKLLVRDSFADDCGYEAVKPLQSVTDHVSSIQPESEFIHISPKMLVAGVMIDAMQSALHDSPHALDSICVDVTPDILPIAVIDTIVTEEKAIQIGVRSMLIRIELAADLHVIIDRRINLFRSSVGNRLGNGLSRRYSTRLFPLLREACLYRHQIRKLRAACEA